MKFLISKLNTGKSRETSRKQANISGNFLEKSRIGMHMKSKSMYEKLKERMITEAGKTLLPLIRILSNP